MLYIPFCLFDFDNWQDFDNRQIHIHSRKKDEHEFISILTHICENNSMHILMLSFN
jgi:hypothetical protein